MGFYVNPQDESKESFLEREGTVMASNPQITWESVSKGYLPVALVDNGFFTAAAITYSERELQKFTRLDDTRPRTIFMVKIEKLLPVADANFTDYALRNNLV